MAYRENQYKEKAKKKIYGCINDDLNILASYSHRNSIREKRLQEMIKEDREKIKYEKKKKRYMKKAQKIIDKCYDLAFKGEFIHEEAFFFEKNAKAVCKILREEYKMDAYYENVGERLCDPSLIAKHSVFVEWKTPDDL